MEYGEEVVNGMLKVEYKKTISGKRYLHMLPHRDIRLCVKSFYLRSIRSNSPQHATKTRFTSNIFGGNNPKITITKAAQIVEPYSSGEDGWVRKHVSTFVQFKATKMLFCVSFR